MLKKVNAFWMILKPSARNRRSRLSVTVAKCLFEGSEFKIVICVSRPKSASLSESELFGRGAAEA
jgi:hypothetical protein